MRDMYFGTAEIPCQPEIFPVDRGGTGGTTVEDAQRMLELIPNTELSAQNGILQLDAAGMIPMSAVPMTMFGKVMLSGPKEVVKNTQAIYTITNFDSRASYLTTVSSGALVRVNATMTFTAPATTGTVTLLVGDKEYQISVVDVLTNQPQLLSPTNNAVNQTVSCTITADEFLTMGGEDVHFATTWQLSTDPDFNSIFLSSMQDTVNLTSWTVGGLTYNTRYYVRVKYIGELYGESLWSETFNFLTTEQSYSKTEFVKIESPTSAPDGFFGRSVAISKDGTRVVIGSSGYDDDTVVDCGKVSVYQFNNGAWVFECDLFGRSYPTGRTTENEKFGRAVAINADGTAILVGADGYTDGDFVGCGAAYLFINSGGFWNIERKFTMTNPATNARFGSSVAIDSAANAILIGASLANTVAGNEAGTAYLYNKDGFDWTMAHQFLAPNAAEGDGFGSSVAISSSGDHVIIGAPLRETNTGAVYSFACVDTVWAYVGALTPANTTVNSSFGYSIAMNDGGDCAVVGAPTEDSVTGVNTGSAHIFEKTTGVWSETTTVVANDRAINDFFGTSVAIDTDGVYLAIGALYSDAENNQNAGAVYGFIKTEEGWDAVSKITPNVQETDAFFGTSVSVDGGGVTLFIGAYGASDRKGAVYIFH